MDALDFGKTPVLDFEKDPLTPEQAAEILHCKPSTLANWRRRGEGPKAVKIGKAKVAYTRQHLVEFVLRAD
jgi:hypothetical protein